MAKIYYCRGSERGVAEDAFLSGWVYGRDGRDDGGDADFKGCLIKLGERVGEALWCAIKRMGETDI